MADVWQRIVRAAYGAGDVFLVALGLVGLLAGRPASDDPGAVLAAALMTGFGVCGVVARPVMPRADGRRRDPVLGTAPSGAAATCFLRSAVVVVLSGVLAAILAVWLGAFAVVVFADGCPVWALLATAGLLLLMRRLVRLVTGRAGLGGLWLTRAGVEYARIGTRWTVSWEQLDRVLRPTEGDPASPPPGRLHTEPVFLVLRDGAGVERTRPAWWLRRSNRYPLPDDVLVVDTFGLGATRSLVAATIERHLRHPGLRANLGTAGSIPRCGVEHPLGWPARACGPQRAG